MGTDLLLTLQEVGLHPEKYAGHSFRIGAATTAAACGVQDFLMGRWESVTVYGRKQTYTHTSAIHTEYNNTQQRAINIRECSLIPFHKGMESLGELLTETERELLCGPSSSVQSQMRAVVEDVQTGQVIEYRTLGSEKGLMSCSSFVHVQRQVVLDILWLDAFFVCTRCAHTCSFSSEKLPVFFCVQSL